MGTKYSSQSTSGYNASPPVDDGTASEANKVKWSTIKTKLSDVLKTFGEAINSSVVTALDQSCRAVTANDSAGASDHNRTIQVNTSSVSITLADATTMAAGYIVSVANNSSGNISVALATSTDTIDAVTNTTQTIFPNETRRYIVNSTATGYLTAGAAKKKRPTRQVFTSGSGTYTTPTGATYINIRMVGGGGGGGGNGTANQTGGVAGGDTTFSTFTAGGGGGGGPSGANAAGAGGTTAGSPDIGLVGGIGGLGTNSAAVLSGGAGGVGAFGGAGPAGQNGGGGASGKTNTGGGGGGAGGASGVPSASGGGAGGYVEHRITTVASTYSYGVGAAGTGGSAGTSGAAGGAGGSGLIIVDEFYN